MTAHYVYLILGVLFAAIGGELFVRGAVGFARWMRVAPGIIGATVAAFATSSPELSVAIQSSLAGEPEISLGNALGSNIVNVALILGLAVLISGMKASRDTLKRDYPVALGIAAAIMLLSLDGILSRLDGGLLLSGFLAWLVMVLREVRKQRDAAGEVLGSGRPWVTLLAGGVGLVFLVAAGSLVVSGARGIARHYGVGEFVIGATVVAIGTTMPELATTLLAKIRGHDEVGLGTVLGSNIFNGLFIVGVAAVLCPIQVARIEVAVACVFALAAILAAWPGKSGFLDRGRGLALVALHCIYLGSVLLGLAY